MEKIIFEDLPSTNTPISATNLNAIQTNVEDVFNGEEAMGSIVVDDINCKNLFNKDNVNKLNAYFNESTPTITSNDANRTLYIPCKPNTTYAITIPNGTGAYAIGYTSSLPALNTSVSEVSNTLRTITTDANAKYLVMRYFQTAQATITEQQALDGIQIEVGDTATSYTPYKKIIKEENGYVKEDTTFYANDFKCKNLLSMASSQTINGVTFTVNQDGTITLSGTATAVVFFPIKGTNNLFQYIQGQIYTLSGCPAGGDYSNKYALYTDIGTQKESDIGEGVTFTATGTTGTIYIVVRRGQNVNGLVFKPQLEVGSEVTPYTEYKTFGSKWVSLGSTTSNNQISLPSNFEEIFALVKTNNSDFRKLTFVIPRIALDTTTQYFNTAFIGSSTSTYNGARIAVSTTTANLDSAYNDGSDVRSNTTTYWYIK